MPTNPPHRTEITRDDIIPMSEYAKIRAAKRAELVEIKRNRRVPVGPDTTVHFENYATVWSQIHERLWAEKGGDAPVADALRAGNPHIPNGHELIATIVIHIEDPSRREAALARLGGIERTLSLQFAGETIKGVPEPDRNRSRAAGDLESGWTVRFPFTPGQIEKFRHAEIQVIVAIEHAGYGHRAVMPEAVRQELAKDLVL